MPGIITTLDTSPSFGSRPKTSDENETLTDFGYREATDPDWVLEQSWQTIIDWESSSEVFWLKRGGMFAAAAAGITAMPIFYNFRKLAYKMESTGKKILRGFTLPPPGMKTHCASAVAITCPFILTYIMHRNMSLKWVFTQDPPCAPCRQIRAISLQIATGFLYPVIMCLLGVKYIVHNELNRPIYQKGQALTWVTKVIRGNKTQLMALMALNTMGTMALHYLQEKQWYNLNLKLLTIIKDSKIKAASPGSLARS